MWNELHRACSVPSIGLLGCTVVGLKFFLRLCCLYFRSVMAVSATVISVWSADRHKKHTCLIKEEDNIIEKVK